MTFLKIMTKKNTRDEKKCKRSIVDTAIKPAARLSGIVDFRKGIDGLAMIIGDKYKQNPFEKGMLFLFCGQCSDRIKGLLWQGIGFLLLYKRLEDGRSS